MRKKRIKFSSSTEDRTSELPQHLLHLILSFLPTLTDVVRTSSVSKTWKNAWTSFPLLNFDKQFFTSMGIFSCQSKTKRMNLMNFVDQILRRRLIQRISTEKLVLYIPWRSRVDRFIHYALEINTLDLTLHTLPQALFQDIKSSPLKKLSLSLSNVRGDYDQIVENLIHCCPNLEYLTLVDCRDLKSLKISSLKLVKSIELNACPELKILEIVGASRLRDFSFAGWFNKPQIRVSDCGHLRRLNFLSASITDLWLHENLSKFPHLEVLDVQFCSQLKRVKISSHSLKQVSLKYCRNMVGVEIDSPALLDFTFHGRNIISFTSNALALFKVTFHLHPNKTDDLWFRKKEEFLELFKHCKLVNLL